jgi:peptidoglycan/xylan/chitin deacetylase (PgdA/CDA1 family)
MNTLNESIMKSYTIKFPHGIMFHHFHGNNHPIVQGSIGKETLSDMLEFIGIKNILNADEWAYKFQNQTLKSNQVCLTFDDALKSQVDIALPILRSYGLTGFFFIYSSIFEGIKEKLEIYRYFRTTQFSTIEDFYEYFFNYLKKLPLFDKIENGLKKFNSTKYLKNWAYYTKSDKKFRYIRDQILTRDEYSTIMDTLILESKVNLEKIYKNLWISEKDLKKINKDKHVIGLHSYSHPTNLSVLSYKDQNEEYFKNKKHLEKINSKIFVMAHPSNSYNEDTLKILKNFKITMGFRADMNPIQSNLEIPRQDHSIVTRMLY